MRWRLSPRNEETIERMREAKDRLQSPESCVRCRGTGMALVTERRRGVNLFCRRCEGTGREPVVQAAHPRTEDGPRRGPRV